MGKLLLFALLLSRDTIITTLAPTAPTRPPSTSASPIAQTRPPSASSTGTRATPATPVITLRILNTSATALKNLVLDWSLQSAGTITKKGKSPIPFLLPNKPSLLRLPLHLPDDTAGETFLQLHYRSALPAQSDQYLPTQPDQQLSLKNYEPHLTIPPAGEITLSDSNDIFTIHSPSIRISFNRQSGWLVHYEINGIDLLDDTLGLKSNFWWPGYNDSANFYVAESARNHADSTTRVEVNSDSGWLAATRDPHLQLFSNTTSTQEIIIRTEYTLPATACLLHLSYTINANGEMLITQHVEPDTSQPAPRPWQLPCFGMQWFLPPGYDSITEYGPLPATPPDSPWIGIFHDHSTVPTPSDLHPRATSTRTNLRWWIITNKNGNGLQFIADTPLLNISALHSFDSNSEAQVSIDRPASPAEASAKTSSPATPRSPADWPILRPMGNYRYTYKVKPLVSFTRL